MSVSLSSSSLSHRKVPSSAPSSALGRPLNAFAPPTNVAVPTVSTRSPSNLGGSAEGLLAAKSVQIVGARGTAYEAMCKVGNYRWLSLSNSTFLLRHLAEVMTAVMLLPPFAHTHRR